MIETTLAGAPVLLAGDADAHAAVLWYHGYRASKNANADELRRIAEAGFFAIGVDAVGHGARADDAIALPQPGEVTLDALKRVVGASVAEVPRIVDALPGKRVSITGVSMGGFIAYRALDAEPRLACCVSILGAPPEGWTPHVPLLSIVAERDTDVPPHAAIALHEPLGDPHRLIVLQRERHLMSEEAWQRTMDETIEWLRRYGR